MKKEMRLATLCIVFVWTLVSFANEVPVPNVHDIPSDLSDVQQSTEDEVLWKLGKNSEFGFHSEQSFSAAMSFFNKSAELGNEKAQSSLGFFWETGKLGQINEAVALIYYAFAAEQKEMNANMALAYRYHIGHGVQKSCSSAAYRYQKVAEEALLLLRNMNNTDYLSSPMKVSYHMLESARIYEQTEENFESSERFWKNGRLSNRVRSVSSNIEEELDIVQYYHYSADAGDVTAMVTMGILHMQGIFGVEQDFSTAFQYFSIAAEEGDPSALTHLGIMYFHGLGVQQNNATAFNYFKEAIQSKNSLAHFHLGMMYLHGSGIPKNVAEAVKHLKAASDQGESNAQYELGLIHSSPPLGSQINRDYPRALQWLGLAAQQGHLGAMYELGQMHLQGVATSQNCHVASQYFKKVAEHHPTFADELFNGLEAYLNGSIPLALQIYEHLASLGIEVAQSSTAYLIHLLRISGGLCENDETTEFCQAFPAERELFYWKLSAEQHNAASHLKIADFYFYEKPSLAATHYQFAADSIGSSRGQAYFNLGYMQLFGIGVSGDIHLAKRNLDLCLQTDAEGVLAVYILYPLVFWYLIGDNFGKLSGGLEWDTVIIFGLLGFVLMLFIVKRNLRPALVVPQ